MYRAALVLILLLLSLRVLATTPPLKYDPSGSSNWYPYFINDQLNPGILNQLIPQILHRADLTGIQVTLPAKRTLKAMDSGDLDFDTVSPSWFPNHQIPEQFVLSEPLFNIQENLVYLPVNRAKWQTSDAIHGEQVGTVLGYFYHNDDDFLRYDFKSERELIKALQYKRVEVIIAGDLPAIYWAKKLNIAIEIGPVHSSGQLHIRLQAKYRDLLPAINQAISSLKNDGTLEKTLANYQ